MRCGIVEADDLVVLDQIDAVGLQPAERFVELPRRPPLRPAVDLGHQEDALAVAVAERLAHPQLALAVVVVPGVVHEGDAAVDRGADDADAERLVDVRQGEVPAAEPDRGYPLAGLPPACDTACLQPSKSVISYPLSVIR